MEGSLIFEDANVLENVLKDTFNRICPGGILPSHLKEEAEKEIEAENNQVDGIASSDKKRRRLDVDEDDEDTPDREREGNSGMLKIKLNIGSVARENKKQKRVIFTHKNSERDQNESDVDDDQASDHNNE